MRYLNKRPPVNERMRKTIFALLFAWAGITSGDSAQNTADRCGHCNTFKGPGIDITRGKTQVIFPEQEIFCPAANIFRFANGDIQVSLPYNSPPAGYKSRRSSDGGKTWVAGTTRFGAHAYQFPDGEMVCFDDMEHRPTGQQVRRLRDGVYKIDFFRSTDNGHTERKEEATLYIPDVHVPKTYVNHSIIRIRDGSLLACYQTADQQEGVYNGRSHVMRSEDRGKTWHYRSTVAFDLALDLKDPLRKRRSEGFCEPALLALANGDLLCFMRSGGSSYDDTSTHSPLYLSRSDDDGKTWSHADPIADRGVFPNSVLMKNGIIAVVYGRRGNWIMFSPDQGKTWGGAINFDTGPEPRDCGNYFSLTEVAQDTILVVYSRANPNDCTRSEIWGTYFTVRRSD